MKLQLRWVGQPDLDRVAHTRLLCYGTASKDLPMFQESLRADERAQLGDFLLAEQNGHAVGTATSLSMSMWMRGKRLSCQGVAWVGTIKTHRRSARSAGSGIASQIMRETLRMAREREEIVTALMPFRGSFYEHFGYGIVERRCTWTVPLAILPNGPFDGVEFLGAELQADLSVAWASRPSPPSDQVDPSPTTQTYATGQTPIPRLTALPDLAACRQRIVEQGQCDIERASASWNSHLKKWDEGFVVVDRSTDGVVHGYLSFQHQKGPDSDTVNVAEIGYETAAGLLRLLHFLATLRDQYTYAKLQLPADFPLNRLLREPQLPHRIVNHPHATVHPFTRMQLRILDHRRLLDGLRLSTKTTGKAVVRVHETEGETSQFAIDIAEGRTSASASAATPDFECTDKTWAAIVSGDLPASVAARIGLATLNTAGVESTLDALAAGPAPFCQEYF